MDRTMHAIYRAFQKPELLSVSVYSWQYFSITNIVDDTNLWKLFVNNNKKVCCWEFSGSIYSIRYTFGYCNTLYENVTGQLKWIAGLNVYLYWHAIEFKLVLAKKWKNMKPNDYLVITWRISSTAMIFLLLSNTNKWKKNAGKSFVKIHRPIVCVCWKRIQVTQIHSCV